MPLGNPTGGASYAAEFQSSGLPWLTSSVALASPAFQRVDFPYVTRFLTLINNDSTNGLKVSATANGMNSSGNNVTVPKGMSLTLEWRLTSVFFQGNGGTCAFGVAAGLTTVRAMDFPQLSGTLDDGSKGWPGVG